MGRMKSLSAALLVDVVASRSADRDALHRDLLAAAESVSGAVAATDPLRPTVGDELQGVYATVGEALLASYLFRLELAPTWDVRFGIGGGEVRTVDDERGIQDGSAWWLAREAIDWVKEQSQKKGHESARTAIRDERPEAVASTDALTRLIDAHLARLRDGALGTLRGMLKGLDNAEIAKIEGISESGNSQRVLNNDLRPLADAIQALATLP